jgi:hypothetical protein
MKQETEKSSVLVQLLAGGGSAVLAKTATAPLERVRIMQQTSGQSAGILFSGIRRNEGIAAYWRGNLPAIMRIFPTYALRLTLFDRFKTVFGKKDSFAAGLMSGCLSSFITTLATYPLDVIRTRMATEQRLSLRYTIEKIRAEKAFYKGLTINLFEAVPYVGISLAVYDSLKIQFPSVSHLLLATGTGLYATATCFPLDTLRRYLVVNPYTNISHGFHKLWSEGKVRRFYRGLPVSLIKAGPTVGLILTLNDAIKKALSTTE